MREIGKKGGKSGRGASKGFAAMDKEEVQEIASKGGKAKKKVS